MNNKQPIISFVFDRRHKATFTTKGALELRVCHNYQQKWISTGVMLYAHQWKNDKIINCPDAMIISQALDKLVMNIRQIILNMQQKGKIVLSNIPLRLKEMEEGKINFLEFCKQRAEIRKYKKAKDSQERYDRFLKYFIEWGKIQSFEDVTEQNIILYDQFLTKTGMKPYSKWNNYHRFLNSFILDAIDAGYLKKNPYRWVNIEKDKSVGGIGKYLSPEEFRKIKNTPMPTESLTHVRDVFVFQTYTCLSYSDLREFDPKQIQEIKGMYVYVGKRKKTNMTFTIPLLSPAMEILHRYSGELPIISNVKYNEYLKVVAQTAGIDKPVSTHWARHTGATMLLNEGVDMRIVSKICGHSSTKITEQVYAKLLDETVVDAISKVQQDL